jgi:MFS family permease
MHGREQEAEDNIAFIEREVAGQQGAAELPPIDDSQAIEIRPQDPVNFVKLAKVLFVQYTSRSVLGASLMITQSFLYNAIFFTYTLVLTKVYGISSSLAPAFLIAFAVGNLVGPLTIGRFFDSIGRRKMIAGTYILSGVLLAVSAGLFQAGLLNAYTQTVAWCIIFFFASAGASAAYLTVSEIFPMEIRAQAIALFFAIAQCFGAIGPLFYGWLIGDGSNHGALTLGYLIGAAVMVAGGLVEVFLGIDAEGKSLEDVANPLSMVKEPA